MNEIICPHCKKAFKIDEAGFADILKQVRDREFDKELNERLEMLERDKDNAVKLAKVQAASEMQVSIAKKEAEIADLKSAKDLALAQLSSQKDRELAEKKLAVNEAVNAVEKQRDTLAGELKIKEAENRSLVTSLRVTIRNSSSQ